MVLEGLERSSQKPAGRPSFKPAKSRWKKLVRIVDNKEHCQAGGPSQYYKDAWVGTDPSSLPGICSETLEYDNCFSGWYTSACSLPYDYASIMHYASQR